MSYGYRRRIVYDENRWNILRKKRFSAIKMLKTLSSCGIINPIVHGSVARGDVDEHSDVDVALLRPYSPSLLELCIERRGYSIYSKKIVMPTPIHTPKLYIYLDPFEELIISDPLAELSPIEVEFYKFSGMVEYNDLLRDVRVAGVDKRLMLIEPVEDGHVETPVVGNEGYVARRLGVSIEVVLDRVEALTKRVREGHTGLFIEYEVPPNTNTEAYIEFLCRENSLFRDRVRDYGLCI